MRAVVLSGGPTHDFTATTARLTALLTECGAHSEIHTDVDDAIAALEDTELLVVNALRWTMTAPGTPPRYRERAEREGTSPSAASREAFARHLAGGGGVLAIHTAVICFDDWPEWSDALGGAWVWGTSHHPEAGTFVAEPHRRHPLTDGIGRFRIVDELYRDLHVSPGVETLLTAAGQPLLWAREHGGGRVVYDALGHHPPSYDAPLHREILRRAICWVTGG